MQAISVERGCRRLRPCPPPWSVRPRPSRMIRTAAASTRTAVERALAPATADRQSPPAFQRGIDAGHQGVSENGKHPRARIWARGETVYPSPSPREPVSGRSPQQLPPGQPFDTKRGSPPVTHRADGLAEPTHAAGQSSLRHAPGALREQTPATRQLIPRPDRRRPAPVASLPTCRRTRSNTAIALSSEWAPGERGRCGPG